MPVPTVEMPILEKLITIRAQLTALKKDRHEYIRQADVMKIYGAVIKSVSLLNEIREESLANDAENAEQEQSSADADPNRVDTTLADVFQLLSLFFLTIGKSRAAPATYCQLATIKNLLDHMNESGVYTQADLVPFQTRIKDLKAMIVTPEEPSTPACYTNIEAEAESDAPPPSLTKLLLRKYTECNTVLKKLQEGLQVLSVELVPIHQKLITIRRQMAAAAAKNRGKVKEGELEALKEELRKIENKRVDGKFLVGSSAPAGQAIVAGLLEENFEIMHDIEAKDIDVADALKPIYDRLLDLRAQLERLVLTHRWTLRETDLYNYQVSLAEIDHMRVDGVFLDQDGNKPDGQRVLLYLLRRCYGLIYRLMSSSEPISEELMPVANKLSTVRRCLNEVMKFGGPFSNRDLYPYQLALAQIDALRVDGKFLGSDGSVPEGQAILNAHLAESHEMIQMLKEDVE